MLIPSIDLQAGRVVQLVQGERLAVESIDIDHWVERFTGYPKVQLIDLDAAKNEGSNEALVAALCTRLPCRVGGGVRTIAGARRMLEAGATHVIVGSALFGHGSVNIEFATALADGVGADRLIAAVDSRAGKVVVDGWRTQLALTPVDAIHALEPFVSEFLYTHVDREGLMAGTDVEAIVRIRSATSRAITAAGGITTMEEVDYLDSIGVDAVVGMAIYTGRLKLPSR
jgi:phosphoribosylformimino-5-aminoimidazole carboxamide ribotide isomerase